MQDEQDLSQEKQPFVPAVDPEKLSEGRIFWVETKDGSKLNIGNVETLSIKGPPWVVEAVTTSSKQILIGEYDSEETAKLAVRYIARDSEALASGRPISLPNERLATQGGKYDGERVLKRYQVETTPLDGE